MEKETICEVGCLISSIAMALNKHRILVDGKTANPASLNTWLQQNNGYVPHDELVEGSLEKLSPKITYVGPRIGKLKFDVV